MARDRGRGERSDTELVLAAVADDPAAYGQLFERWFDRAWNVARTILRDDDLAADVAQDTMVKAWQQLDELRDPDAFGGWLLRSARNRALSRLAREGRSRATGDDVVSGLRDRGEEDPVGAERQPQPDAVSEIRDRQELVWAAATALGERDVSLLDLHLRHGLSPAEIADELGVEANAAHQQLFRLRGRLGDAIGSYLLWRGGRPLCEGLAEAVSGRTAFDRSVARAVARHQSSCEHCSQEQESLVDPAKLFAAAPLLLVPPHLKAQAAAALDAAGVTVDGHGGTAADGSGGADQGGGGTDGTDGGVDAGTGPGNGPQPDGIGLELDPVRSGPVAGGEPTVALADHVVTGAGGPSAIAPSLALPRGRAVALAGAGFVAVVAVIVIGALALRDGSDDGGVAAIGSELPEPLAAAQDGTGEEAPAGPASFAPSADDSDTTSSASTARSTTVTDRTTTTSSTTETTSTTSSTTSTTEESTTTTDTTTTVDDDTTSSIDDDTTSSVDDDTTSSSDPPPVDPPLIVRFISRTPTGPLRCADRDQRPFEAVWLAENTDSVTLDVPNGSTTGAASGSYAFCGSTGQKISLVATGPGGVDKASTTL